MNLIYEHVGVEPAYRGKTAVADLNALKRVRLAELSTKPALLEPILHLLFAGLYLIYGVIWLAIDRAGHTVGEYLRELADV